ncbi:MAG TPA: hypothetical protein VHE34_29965 [Puia sp.]|jgi:hypothetical protein|uniref:hypothetical protein n=1 Tax=Puia sp. TaxID=2045100 RepID=UPI002C3D72C1|nr:hypothetical protein [Puia sp.]HVU99499.1 hypothetical protein [Puia sp.]
MLAIYETCGPKKWDKDMFCKCCEKPAPPDPSSDCCYNTWQWELIRTTREYNLVTKELQYVQKHLDIITARTTRLKTWFDELTSANELARKVCHQLEVIEAQVVNICINTEFTVKAIRILFCMVREFYVEVDCLQTKYDCLNNCLKCLNPSSISATQGIGKALADYATALAALIATRDNLLKLVMAALAMAEQLHWEICDNCGFKRLLIDWSETLHCGVTCGPIEGECRDEDEPDWEKDCLFPILQFPLCNTHYYKMIDNLYHKDKKKMDELTVSRQRLTKRQLSLQAGMQSLQKALSEVGQTARC